MRAPVTYISSTFNNPDRALNVFLTLRDELNWVRRDGTPRQEYYWNKHNVPYTYGSGRGVRTYDPQPNHPMLDHMRDIAYMWTGIKYDVIFLNRYDTAQDQLKWHADNSPEMDDTAPIVIISLGSPREIWFRANDVLCNICEAAPGQKHDRFCSKVPGVYDPDNKDFVDKLLLEPGSVCIMAAGMQDTHMHRIPKSSSVVDGPRISLTLRRYVDPNQQK